MINIRCNELRVPLDDTVTFYQRSVNDISPINNRRSIVTTVDQLSFIIFCK